MSAIRRAAALLAVLALLAAAGCGGAGGGGGDVADERVRLLLDFAPNGVHAGMYLALARGFDTAEGVDISLRPPSTSTDAVRLLRTGRVDAAVVDIHDLGLARERGADLVAFAAVVQRPLAAVLAQPQIRTPKDLEGRTAGVAGLPSDTAVLRSVVRGAGGDPRRVREVTIGFDAVAALLSGRVAGATAFWNVEGVALEARRPATREFRVDDFGAPGYPELVLATTRAELQDERDALDPLVRAFRRGYAEAAVDPESAATAMLDRTRGLRRDALRAQIDAVAPAWSAGVPAWGVLDRAELRAWARWDVRFGILHRAPALDRAFAFGVGD